MTSEECIIQVHVRRTGEFVSINIIPLLTTYGDIIKLVCEQINESQPDHYYLVLNNEIELENDIVFNIAYKDNNLKMVMKTKYILEYIAEQTMQKQKLKPEVRDVLNSVTPITEVSSVPAATIDKIPEEPTTLDIPISTNVISNDDISTSEISNQENKVIIGDVVRSTIKRIPRQDVQQYLHEVLEKSFDILLMGSPRVGKSTLINAILKKDLAKTSAGRNACTTETSYYEYKEIYSSSNDDKSGKTTTCSIRIWDAPGIEDWTKLDIAKHIQKLIEEKNPICLIYCASPGSHVDTEHIKVVIEQCKKLKVFIALVVTNMYASDEADDILDIFKTLLAVHNEQTKAVEDVFHYGNIGLCTLVNSVEYIAHGQVMKQAGVDDLMLGVMNSLSDEKLLQWCFALMDNGPFWVRTQSRIYKAFNFIKSWLRY